MKLFRLNMSSKHKYYVYIYIAFVSICLSETTCASDLNKNEDSSKNTVVGWLKNLENDHNKDPQELALRLSVDQDATKDFFSHQRIYVADDMYGFDLPEYLRSPFTKKFAVHLNVNAMKANESLKVLMVATGLGRNIPWFLDQTTSQKFATINFILNDINPKNYRVLQAIHQYVIHTSDPDKVPPYIVEQFKRVSFMPGNILELDFERNSLNGIMAENVLHLFTPHQIIDFYQKANSSLKLNGFLKITTHTPYLNDYILKQQNMPFYSPEAMASTYGKANDPHQNRKLMCLAAYCDFIMNNKNHFIRLNPDVFVHQRALIQESGFNRTFLRKNILEILGINSGLNLKDFQFFATSFKENSSELVIDLCEHDNHEKNFISMLQQKVKDLPSNHQAFKELYELSDIEEDNLINGMKDNYILAQPQSGDVFFVHSETLVKEPRGAEIIRRAKKNLLEGEKAYQENKKNRK